MKKNDESDVDSNYISTYIKSKIFKAKLSKTNCAWKTRCHNGIIKTSCVLNESHKGKIQVKESLRSS